MSGGGEYVQGVSMSGSDYVGGMSGVGGYPPSDMGPQGVLTPSLRQGIQWDMVGKRAVCILLECLLVGDINEKLL